MHNRRLIVGAVVVSLFLFTLATTLLFRFESQKKPLPVLGQVRDFQLLDSKGKDFTLHQLRGKVWVADFIFTTCGDICPRMSKHMAALQRSFNLRDDVAFVSITVNPEYDSPEVLAKYAEEYQANTTHWYFLTGSREKITDLMLKSFKMGSVEEPIFHSAMFALVDRNRYIRGYYDGTKQESMNQLFHDMARVLKEWPR